MGTRRSVSARSSGSVRGAAGVEYDPLESEADRLLATTCARLGRLGVGAGDVPEEVFVEHEDGENVHVGREYSEIHKDILRTFKQVSEAEKEDFAIKRELYHKYRTLVGTYIVSKDLLALVKETQYSVRPPLDLTILIEYVTSVLETSRKDVMNARDKHGLPDFNTDEQDLRHAGHEERRRGSQAVSGGPASVSATGEGSGTGVAGEDDSEEFGSDSDVAPIRHHGRDKFRPGSSRHALTEEEEADVRRIQIAHTPGSMGQNRPRDSRKRGNSPDGEGYVDL